MPTSNFFKFTFIFLLSLGIFLRFFRANEMFSFNFDQETAAAASYDFFKNGQISIIGQELSFKGFFLGPLHHWIQFIPYSICNLRPDCVPYFFALTGIITGLIFYQVASQIFSRKIALISLLMYFTSAVIIEGERSPNSNYFLFLASTILLYCLHKYYQGKNIFFVLGSFIGGIAIVNFNPIFIFTQIAYFAAGAIRPKRSIKTIFLGVILSLFNLLPLVIFNLRHENIIYLGFTRFLQESGSFQNLFDKFFFIVSKIATPYYSNFYFLSITTIYLFGTTAIITLAFYFGLISKRKIYLFLIMSILTAVFGFLFYKRHIPDYYFIQTLPALILLTATVLAKRLIFFLVFMPLFLWANLNFLFNFKNTVSYQFKKMVVEYVISDSKNNDFNVYFNFPTGQNTGFNYLFKLNGKAPRDFAQTIYILDFNEDKYFNSTSYYKSFGSNLLQISKIDSMKIIKVKAEPVN